MIYVKYQESIIVNNQRLLIQDCTMRMSVFENFDNSVSLVQWLHNLGVWHLKGTYENPTHGPFDLHCRVMGFTYGEHDNPWVLAEVEISNLILLASSHKQLLRHILPM